MAMVSGDSTSLRVLVVDDHPVFVAGLRSVLEAVPTVEVVADAAHGAAVSSARRLRPHVVIMDTDGSNAEGLRAARQISAECPDIAIIALTRSARIEGLQAALRAGVRGYLPRDADRGDITRSVHAVSRGQIVFGAHVVHNVIGQFAAAEVPGHPFPQLTEREKAVLDLVADGVSNQAIARELELSLKTVRNYLSRIFAKIESRDRSEAVVKARRAGLGQ
jgi:DNA-binding NarL/FixJ family response regulator